MYGVKFTLKSAFSLLLLLLVSVNVLGEDGGTAAQNQGERAKPKPLQISNERIQLLEDALGWMTFRKNGQLMTKEQLAALFLDPLKQRYLSSNFFRTFVIAFEYGVLPKLTLNEGEACDPDYTMHYKDPFESSATWYEQQKFVFNNYNFQGESSTEKFCDYRQGLVCKAATQTCECPEGSKMQEVSPGSPVKRCLLKENEICALIDIAHGDDPNHKALADNMHQLIFNLEKPVSCLHGTQCRFKSPDITFSRCYNVNGGPWAPPYVDKFGNTKDTWTLDFGEECVLGLYASPGSCPRLNWRSERIGKLQGYTCYNFGPPRSQISSGGAKPENRTGFCAHDYGPYGIAELVTEDDHIKSYLPLFSPFVTPRTVPLRGRELGDFHRKFLEYTKYFSFLNPFYNIQEDVVFGSCSSKKTESWEQTWSYFASLENDPPPGQDYVPQATKTELWAHLESMIQLTRNKSRVCRIYADYEFYDTDIIINGVPQVEAKQTSSLKCVSFNLGTNVDGDDGSCEEPGTLDTKSSDNTFYLRKRYFQHIEEFLETRELSYNRKILQDHPDGVCLPAIDQAPKERTLGGRVFCADGYVCYKDYSDTGNKYDQNCNLLSSEDLNYVCHASGNEERFSKCEAKWQDKSLSKELERMGDALLNRGESCPYDIERSIRDRIASSNVNNTNKYKVLHWLERTRLSGGLDGGLCDRTKLLECKETGICECVENTQPRVVTVDGVEYQSDYCYKTMGSCTEVDPTSIFGTPLPLTQLEKQGIWKHYGNPSAQKYQDYSCNDTNLCVYLNENDFRFWCTANNTGKTGYDLTPVPEPESGGGEPNLGGGTRRPGWHIGGGCTLRMNERLVGSLLLAMFMNAAAEII